MASGSRSTSSADRLLELLRRALGPEYDLILERLENYFNDRYGSSFVSMAFKDPLRTYKEASGLAPEYVVRAIFAALLRLRSESKDLNDAHG